ncbi:PP2C family protein-serine/threonine phosphatase [Shewanella fidelis]|uniref:Serine/threonine protein phosphatase n=1 Tax=Shewanella fidelis TaxID=173509 RepID=A0AAW8NKV4_9GAMM|nr:serine/threonine protein phosphatase [Shewanella fidelis]MDR8523828.1 serine/threonine protein phosphatase [Shewanella fidelis]MDW4810376.1 serine/threonine protein phosphatase [Shewanella fidelis]MDW4814521.1 serine/threonine protein phosphatase [Shewanella fidelis]MDW4818611.1 serine/threonine protein phosphatase [Shewanella fidelis]MDW4823736.1 serine/threonine protein phosphatase [Shewanella fidelis]
MADKNYTMEQEAIKQHIQLWLNRPIESGAVRELLNSSVAMASDVGNIRPENQDRVVCVQVQVSAAKSFIIGVLCDGMGGMASGADCASLSIASFLTSCIKNQLMPIGERLITAAEDANNDVYSQYNGTGGATLSAFILDSEGQFEAINVGDSRIYANLSHGIKQYSIDDTFAGQNADAAGVHLSKGLLQFIGVGADLKPQLVKFPKIRQIKRLILTSDGAHYIEASTFKQILNQRFSAAELCTRIIDVSKWCGGYDNTSILIANDVLKIFANTEETAIPIGTVKLTDAFGEIHFIGVTALDTLDPIVRI